MKRTALLVLSLAACHPGQPCPSCDESADATEDTPDLPCGGADLQTDNLNCGTCGNVCFTKAEATDYEAGACVAGVCSPNNWWGQEWLEPSDLTCAAVCATSTGETLSCQANGCAELTGFVCESVLGVGCEVFGGGAAPLVDFAGACDEPIPWPEELGFGGVRNAFCCCG